MSLCRTESYTRSTRDRKSKINKLNREMVAELYRFENGLTLVEIMAEVRREQRPRCQMDDLMDDLVTKYSYYLQGQNRNVHKGVIPLHGKSYGQQFSEYHYHHHLYHHHHHHHHHHQQHDDDDDNNNNNNNKRTHVMAANCMNVIT